MMKCDFLYLVWYSQVSSYSDIIHLHLKNQQVKKKKEKKRKKLKHPRSM